MENSAKNVTIYHFQLSRKFTDNFSNITNIWRFYADSLFPMFPREKTRFNCQQKLINGPDQIDGNL